MTQPVAKQVIFGAALGASVLVPTLAIGGYTPASQSLFAGLAGLALLAALAWHEAAAARMARTAPVAVLGALALLALLSTVWSIDRQASLRWALVIAGYAAVALAAGVVAQRRRGTEALAALIVMTAAIAAVLGLIAWATQSEPFAEKIYGRWRPGGPFEYPPALALVQVCALPALLRWMTRGTRTAAIAAAAGAALASCALVLSGNRLQLALAAVVLVVALLFPARTVAAGRATVFAAVATVALAGLATWAMRRHSAPSPEERLADLSLICVGAAAVWAAARQVVPSIGVSRRWTKALAVVGAVAIAGLAGLWIANLTERVHGAGGLTHSRPHQWRVAIDTAAHRPVLGFGADTFLAASRRTRTGTRTRHAHELPLEAWVELGIPGLALVLALYAVVGRAAWLARNAPAGWLLAPAAAAFLVTNLIDWPWHLAGLGALWAAAVGGVTAAALGNGRSGRPASNRGTSASRTRL